MVGLALATPACGGHLGDPRTKSTPAPPLPEAKSRQPRTPPPPEWFWEPIDADVRTPSRKPLDLPLTAEVSRLEGATRVWDDLPPDARERLRRDGVLVLSDAPSPEAPPQADAGAGAAKANEITTRSFGAFYNDLRERRVPHLITIESLFAFTTLALERTLAEVDESTLAPSITSLLEKLDARLTKEEAGVGVELAEPYRLAHGVIAVAKALATSTVPLTDVRVAEEKARVEAHAGPAQSALLNVPIDYSAFIVPSGAARPGLYRALAWLAAAPLSLVSRPESPSAPPTIDVAQARIQGRAAMILARLTDREIDPQIHALYTHTLKLLAFVWGTPDDLSLVEIGDLAEQAQIDLRKPETLSNVTRVDKLRARAIAGRAPAAFDGSGGAFRGGISARVFGGHAAADSLAMQSLVGPPVGLAKESAAAATVDRLRGGHRVLPSTLDVMAWMGAPEARAVLRETNADAFDGYDKALASAIRARPSAESAALHASVHGSLVDALIAWANPTDAPTMTRSAPMHRARLESMLAAWTMLRHAGGALGQAKPASNMGALLTSDLRVSGGALPVFVEPSPDVVARLVATVRQMRRGLEKLAPLSSTSSALALLVELEDLLRVAQKGAERHVNDEALTTEEASALASLPARLARIEDAAMTTSHGDRTNGSASAKDSTVPIVAVVYSDPPSKRLLVTATGKIEPILTFVREPGKDDPILVVGAHVPHYELIEVIEPPAPGAPPAAKLSTTDGAWRARLAKVPVQRAPFTSSFRWSRSL